MGTWPSAVEDLVATKEMLASRDQRFWVGAISCSTAVVALIWIPFGFAMGGLIEEWGLLGQINDGANLWWVSPDGPRALFAARPLSFFPFALAHSLSPNSFFAWHVLTILELIAKGVLVAYLVRQSFRSNILGVLGGVIAIIFPADTMTISFRSLHINFAMMLVLIGASLSVADLACERPRRLLSTLGAISALASFLTYEAALPLAILPVAVIFTRLGTSGIHQTLRKKAASYAIWFSAPVIYFIYVVIIRRYVPSSYQGSLLSSAGAIETATSALQAVFVIAYPRLLWEGWRDGLSMLLNDLKPLLAIPLLFATATAIWLVASWRRAKSELYSNSLVRALVSGLVIMIAGYLPFALLPSHQAISQRTFLWGAIGATFVITGLLGLIGRRHVIVTYPLFLIFAVPSLAFMLIQHGHYVDLSNTSKAALRSIISQVDPLKINVIVDKTNSIGHTWNLLDSNMQLAVAYLRDTRSQGYSFQVCRASGMEWQHAFPLARRGECREESTDWRFVSPAPVTGSGIAPLPSSPDLVISNKQLQIITVERTPPSIKAAIDHLPTTRDSRERITKILQINPTSALWHLLRSNYTDFFRWSFGDWWSLEKPTPGTGWREAEWEYQNGKHISSAWANRDEAVIDFEFQPTQRYYPLRVRFNGFINPNITHQFRILINGQHIDLTGSDGVYSGMVPSSVLRTGINEFRLIAPVDPKNFGLSAKMDWFELGVKP